MAGPPPGQRQGRHPGPDPEAEGRGNPQLFDVSEGGTTNEEDAEDAHSRVPHNKIVFKARNH